MAPTTDVVLAAMMDDLGLGRMEDLAKDDNHRGGPIHIPLTKSTQSRSAIGNIDPRAEAWNDAVAANAFHDDDSRGVEGLDNIANGRLHAMRKELQQQSTRGGDSGHHRIGTKRSHRIFDKIQLESYDPMQPNARVKTQRRDRGPVPVSNSFEMSSHGVLLPPGTEVKRWSVDRSGRRKLGLSNEESPLRETRPTSTESGRNKSSPTKWRAAPAPASSDLPPHLRSTMRQYANGTSPSVVPTNLTVTTKPDTISTPPPPRNHPANLVANTLNSIPPHKRTALAALRSLPDVPPHLRNARSGQYSTGPAQAALSSQPPQESPLGHNAMSRPIMSRHTPIEGERLNLAGVQEPAPMINIYFEADASMPSMQNEAGLQVSVPGLTFLYQYPNRETIIWELRLDDGRVIREDVRSISQVWETGSIAVMRRNFEGRVRVTSVKLESLLKVKQITKEVASHQAKLRSCSDPIYPYTEETDQKPRMIDISTLLPLDDTMRSKTSLLVASPRLEITSNPSNYLREELQLSNAVTKLEADMNNHDVSEIEADRGVEKKASERARAEEDGHLKLPKGQDKKELKYEGKYQAEPEHNKQYVIIPEKITEVEAEIEVETKMAMEGRKILIDTSPASSKPKQQSHTDYVEGKFDGHNVACPTSTERPLSSAEEEYATKLSAIKSEESSIKTERELDYSIHASSELIMTNTEGIKGHHDGEPAPTDNKAIDIIRLKNTPIGVDLTRKCMAVLANLSPQSYQNISQVFDTMLGALKRSGMYKGDSIEDFTAVQAVLIHQTKSASFNNLSFEEQVKVAAVVLHNLNQLKYRHRIRYTRMQVLGLRCYARPRPPVADLLQEIMNLAKKFNGVQSTPLAQMAKHDGATSSVLSPTATDGVLLPTGAYKREQCLRTPDRLTPTPNFTSSEDKNNKENEASLINVVDYRNEEPIEMTSKVSDTASEKQLFAVKEASISLASVTKTAPFCSGMQDRIAEGEISRKQISSVEGSNFQTYPIVPIQMPNITHATTASQPVHSHPGVMPSQSTLSKQRSSVLSDRTDQQKKSTLPPLLRNVGYSLGRSGLGGSRWA